MSEYPICSKLHATMNFYSEDLKLPALTLTQNYSLVAQRVVLRPGSAASMSHRRVILRVSSPPGRDQSDSVFELESWVTHTPIEVREALV